MSEDVFDDLDIHLALSGDGWQSFKSSMKKAGSAIKRGASSVQRVGENECHAKNELRDEIIKKEGKNKWEDVKKACQQINDPFQTCVSSDTQEKCPACFGENAPKGCSRKLLHGMAQVACGTVKATVASIPEVSVCEWTRK